MTIINQHLVARFFPAADSPLGSSLGWMVLALGALGVAVILLAILSMFSGRRRASSYSGYGSGYSSDTYSDYSCTGNDGSWLDWGSSWFDSSDGGSSGSDFDSSGGDFD